MNIKDLTIRDFHEGLVGKKFSAAEVAKAYLQEIEAGDKKIGSYLRVTSDLALEQAKAVDRRIAKGEEIGVLAGVPLGIKDVILVKDEQVSGASKILKKYTASFDATVIQKLKDAGSVFLGFTNCDEFAMGGSTENSGYGITKNPYDLERVPGGSSGGSAAAVAAGFALGTLGSDTGGSVRQPASFCGVVGLKPTYGAVSRFGLMAMASSLDQIGPMGKTVEDVGLMFREIAGKDRFDSTSVERDWSAVLDFPKSRLKKLTIGVPKEYFSEGMDESVRQELEGARERLEKFGCRFKEVSLPHTELGVACYYIVMPAEVSANVARYDGIRYSRIISKKDITSLSDIYIKQKGRGFGVEVRRRIMLGTFVLSHGYYDAYYAKAQKVRRLITRDFEKVFESGVDMLFTPVSPTPAWKIGEKTEDPLQMYLEDVYTIPTSLAGLPGLSLPVKKYSVGIGELPVGFQLIGPRFGERDLLGLGRAYENYV